VALEIERDRPTYPVRSLEKAIRILDALREAGEPMGISELSTKLELGVSAVHRHLDTLHYHGWVEQDPTTLKYMLGTRFIEFGASVIERLGFGSRTRPYLERLMSEVGETVNLCVADRGEVLFVEKFESERFLRTVTHVGARVPLHCTGMGKAMLAFLPEAELRAFLDGRSLDGFTPYTITDPTSLEAHLGTIRRQGYAVDNEEYIIGVRCIAAPLLGRGGHAVAAVSVSGPTARLSEDRIADVAARVKAVAQEMSRDLDVELLR